MNKEQELASIIDKLNLLDYLEASAEYVRVGPYRVHQKTDMSWELLGDSSDHIFSTRMGALGYAKCLLDNELEIAQRIRQLDEHAGATRSQMQSIKNALRSNHQIEAKEQEARYRHQESLQLLARTVLDLI